MLIPLLALLALLLVALPASAIQVDPGAVFRSESIGTNYTFAVEHHFSQIRLPAGTLVLGSASLQFINVDGTLNVTLTTVSPLAETPLVWSVNISSPSTVSWYNITGLQAHVSYDIFLDSVYEFSDTSDAFGGLNIAELNLTGIHSFRITSTTFAIAAADWTLILFLLVFLVLLVVGFFMPFIHLLCGIEGLFFAFLVFDTTGSVPLAIIISAFAVSIMVLGIVRTQKGYGGP